MKRKRIFAALAALMMSTTMMAQTKAVKVESPIVACGYPRCRLYRLYSWYLDKK